MLEEQESEGIEFTGFCRLIGKLKVEEPLFTPDEYSYLLLDMTQWVDHKDNPVKRKNKISFYWWDIGDIYKRRVFIKYRIKYLRSKSFINRIKLWLTRNF